MRQQRVNLYTVLESRKLIIDADLGEASKTLLLARSQPRQCRPLLRCRARLVLSVAGNDVALGFAEPGTTSFERVRMQPVSGHFFTYNAIEQAFIQGSICDISGAGTESK